MEISNTLYVATREEWRSWLEENDKIENDIWLVYYRKHTGKARIPYNDAVEEALCFGWIDSITKGIHEDCYAQRFTPRKPGSSYSQTNKERLKRLIALGQVKSEVLADLGDVMTEKFIFPADIMAELQANEAAWENFQRYSGSYQRIRVAYIDSARKRPEEFEKRLKSFIKKTEQDKQFGFGIEAYY